jgi:acyl carrier protein
MVMRGLYPIATRSRQSYWFNVPCKLLIRVQGIETEGGFDLARNSLNVELDDGSRIPLLSGRAGMKHIEILYEVLSRQAYEVTNEKKGQRELVCESRVLLRRTIREKHRGKSLEDWDLLISPVDHLTMSLRDLIEDEFVQGKARFDAIIEQLLPIAIPIRWPDWIPNDEAMAMPSDESAHADLHVETWTRLYKIILELFPIEEDQIRKDVKWGDFVMDSLEGVELIGALEDEFDVEIPDEEIDRLFSVELTLGGLCRELYKRARTTGT